MIQVQDDGSGLLFSEDSLLHLRIMTEPIGTSRQFPLQNKTFDPPQVIMREQLYILRDLGYALSQELPIMDERSKIFRKLYDLGYYLCSGLSFGGDYLLYKQNPEVHHADYIVHLKSQIQAQDLISYSRLGVNVKKDLLFCWLDDDRLETRVIRWQRFQS
ncbi:tRNA intron endonuclease [Gorgonomyces haynaldii]|nr:tRNA intron endonuclease [Gorgonomyces haynaldii]